MNSLSFNVFYGKLVSYVDKYEKYQIMFEIQPELQNEKNYISHNLGPFSVMNFIKFDTQIIYRYKPASMEKYVLNIILLKKGVIVDTNELKWANLNNNEVLVEMVQLGQMVFKIIYAVSYSFAIDKSFSIPSLNDQFKDFNIDDEEKVAVYAGHQNIFFQISKDRKTYVCKAPKCCSSLSLKENWVNELAIYLTVEHPNILKMVGYNTIDKRFGFVLEFAKYGSLDNYKEKTNFHKFMSELASTMSYLHSFGIIHRDLKPGNILVNENFDIKIADFGYSRSCGEEMVEDFGTPGFMAPEVTTEYYDYRADVYSAGVVVCFLFDRDNYDEITKLIMEMKQVKSLPIETEIILRSLLSDDPYGRPTFNELAILLEKNYFSISIFNDYVSKSAIENQKIGNDYFYYKESTKSIDLFHCLMFHVVHNDETEAGNMSHLGQLLGDEFMSYYFDLMVLYNNSIAIDIELKKGTSMLERYMKLNADDYRFLLMPLPLKKINKV